MKRRWRKNVMAAPAEIDITAFMNLMVILVPFLLITAVFSRITILNLNLPVPGELQQTTESEKELLHLEVILRENSVEIGDRKRGLLKLIEVTDDDRYLKEISDALQQIKARHPDKTDITLLLENNTPYQRLIEMMDTLRVAQVKKNGSTVFAELFPAISIGDAPRIDKRADIKGI